jgi:hypothetical protein
MKVNSIITILLVVFHASLCAQSNDCKYDKNEVDKFTNKKIIWTKWEHLSQLISREYAPDIRCIVEDTTKQLLISVNGYSFTYDKPTQGQLDSFLVVLSGSKAIFLMEDGKPVELATAKDCHSTGEFKPPYTGDNSSDKFRISWNIGLYYRLDANAINALAAQGVTTVRIFYKPEDHRDYIVAKKKYNSLQNIIYCIK